MRPLQQTGNGADMTKRVHRRDDVALFLENYAKLRTLEHATFNDGIQVRVFDKGFTMLDVWPSTGKYHVVETNYNKLELERVERNGERGELPVGDQKITHWLDRLFYGQEALSGGQK